MKTLLTFPYTGWLIGILIMACYNPYIYNWVGFHPYIKQPTRVNSTLLTFRMVRCIPEHPASLVVGELVIFDLGESSWGTA